VSYSARSSRESDNDHRGFGQGEEKIKRKKERMIKIIGNGLLISDVDMIMFIHDLVEAKFVTKYR
jgi:hypothetical protein